MRIFVLMMKKIASISLLLLLLYNAFGYYALLAFQKEQAKHMAIQNDQKAEYKIIRIPVSAYVHLEDTDFEYTDGQFDYEGQTYNMVKQRRVNDVLEIYVLHNEREDQIAAQINDFVKEQLNTKAPAQKSPAHGMLKSFIKDYIPHPAPVLVSVASQPISKTSGTISTQADKLTSASLLLFAPPPKFA